MSKIRTWAGLVHAFIWASAIYLLYSDPTVTSGWVLMLLLGPLIVSLTHFAFVFRKMWDHHGFPFSSRAVTDVIGTKKDWFLFRFVVAIMTIVAGGYMANVGRGLAGCGGSLIVIEVVCRLLDWFDTTKLGRRLASKLGVPVTPEDDLEMPVERQSQVRI